jgi:cytochrome P450
MHHTNAVLLESFRVTSFVVVSVPHFATADVPLRNYVIPKGSVVLPSLYHAMYDPKHFKVGNWHQSNKLIDGKIND